MELTYRYRIYPSPEQEKIFLHTCDVVRYFYNMILRDRTEYFRGKRVWRKLDAGAYPMRKWMDGADPYAKKSAESQLTDAYENFFRLLNQQQRPPYRPECIEKAER